MCVTAPSVLTAPSFFEFNALFELDTPKPATSPLPAFTHPHISIKKKHIPQESVHTCSFIMSEMTLKEFAHKHNEIIDRMKRVLKFLTKSSNVNKEEVDHIQETFEALKAKAENEGKPATKTMGDLTLEQVQAIFQLTKLTPDNDEAGDMWECNAIKAEDLHCPEDFHEFYAFLREYSLLPS